jgi:CelD/BcsL family acetyltransferase involved in cellulose biosynthesis
LQIEVVRPRDLTAPVIARWTALQASDPALGAPFLSPHWAAAVERAQGQDRVRVAVLDAGKGFIAARVGRFSAMPAGAPMCDYQGVVAEPGLAVDPRKLAPAFGVGRLDFSHMLDSQAAFAPYVRGRTPSWIVDVSAGYDAFEAERKEAGIGIVKDLGKKRRKVEREVGETRFSAFSRSRADFDQLIAWKRGQYRATGQTDIFDTPWTLRLMEQLFAGSTAEFGGALYTLHIGDKLAAAQFNLHGKRGVHGWIIAHDAAFERYSPGLLLFQDILRWMDEAPYKTLDLGAGDYRFKRELSNTQRVVAHGFVGVPSPSALVRGAAYGVRQAAEALPLGGMSELPGKAMRRLDTLRALR